MVRRAWIIAAEARRYPGRREAAENQLREQARSVVEQAYVDRTRRGSEDGAFEAALNAYSRRFPDVPRAIASHAVAELLSTCDGQRTPARPRDRRRQE